MPRFYFRLEAADGSGEFRQGTIHAESAEAARSALKRREFKLAAYDIQDDPYEIVYLGDGPPPRERSDS